MNWNILNCYYFGYPNHHPFLFNQVVKSPYEFLKRIKNSIIIGRKEFYIEFYYYFWTLNN